MSLIQSGNPEHLKAYFWLVCMDTQVWEMREALAKNDFVQFKKELADCAGVALDAIRLLGLGDSFNVLLERFVSNDKKFTPEALLQNRATLNGILTKSRKSRKNWDNERLD